jgi:hypothetical protein
VARMARSPTPAGELDGCWHCHNLPPLEGEQPPSQIAIDRRLGDPLLKLRDRSANFGKRARAIHRHTQRQRDAVSSKLADQTVLAPWNVSADRRIGRVVPIDRHGCKGVVLYPGAPHLAAALWARATAKRDGCRHRPHRALLEWDKANPGTVYDPELFRREILPRLAGVKLSEIAEAAACSKAYASDIRRGRWAPHVSTWGHSRELVNLDLCDDTGVSHTDPRAVVL